MNANSLKKKIYLTNIFLIDWDDTLFPTTWFNNNNMDINNPNTMSKHCKYFKELDKTLSRIINQLDMIGDIYIVTNANLGWIRSCLKTLDLTRNVIIEKKIRIVSARDCYYESYTSPTQWKILTFQDIFENMVNKIDRILKPNTIFNIISIGDAMYEYIALINLDSFIKSYIDKRTNKLNNISYFLKNVKFVEKPDYEYLVEQLQVLEKNKDMIINKMGFIDLKFK